MSFMANEKKTDFVVNDRRKFTLDGEARPDAEPESPEQQEENKVVEMPRAVAAEPPAPSQPAELQEELSPPPTAEETKSSTDAYNASTRQIDERLEKELKTHGGGRKLSDFEMNFEKFIASIYMSALMQLGLVAEQGGQPRADIIGARQTIDTLSILNEKTKGNLTDREDTMLQNVLYELRMAYIEVTNAIARGPQPGGPPPGAGLK
jgi:hypothetical protein